MAIKVLVADDVTAIRQMVGSLLTGWGYETLLAQDGAEALALLSAPDAPQLAILDWMMPELEGVQVCQRLRREKQPRFQYLIILTARDKKQDVAEALEMGADDYITKPFSEVELKARLQAGERIVRLQNELTDKLEQLQQSRRRVQALEELLPICAYCKRIRTDDAQDVWEEVENYIHEQAGTVFTHGICPSCLEEMTQRAREQQRRRS